MSRTLSCHMLSFAIVGEFGPFHTIFSTDGDLRAKIEELWDWMNGTRKNFLWRCQNSFIPTDFISDSAASYFDDVSRMFDINDIMKNLKSRGYAYCLWNNRHHIAFAVDFQDIIFDNFEFDWMEKFSANGKSAEEFYSKMTETPGDVIEKMETDNLQSMFSTLNL